MSNGVVAATAPHARRNLGGSPVLALLAGFLVAVVAFPRDRPPPPPESASIPRLGQPATSTQMAVALAYRSIYGILSSWVTARLAPYNPLGHALVWRRYRHCDCPGRRHHHLEPQSSAPTGIPSRWWCWPCLKPGSAAETPHPATPLKPADTAAENSRDRSSRRGTTSVVPIRPIE